MGNKQSSKKKDKAAAKAKAAPKQAYKFYTIRDNYDNYEDLHSDLRSAGLECSQLIVGVDFTKSNNWTGKRTFGGKCLHHLGTRMNPYQKAIEVIGRTLEPFDDDNLIPAYGFGDAKTTNKAVFPFNPDGSPCPGLHGVLSRYAEVVPTLHLSGPTSFAPLIRQAVELVKETGEYHILLIIADGQVNPPDTEATMDAIEDASAYPLSIIMVGVGDGPWDEMEHYDDNLPARKFDNFQFVDFNACMNRKDVENNDLEFARMAMMEIPEQYKAIKDLGLIEKVERVGYVPPVPTAPAPPPYTG